MSRDTSSGSCSRFIVELDGENNDTYTVPAPNELFDWDGEGLKPRLSEDLSRLEQLRARLPRTLCEQCGRCCQRSEGISTYSIEFYRIAQYLKEEMPPEEVGVLKNRVEYLYFARSDFNNTFAAKTGFAQIPCPMYRPEGMGCLIYSVRPNICRGFGLPGLCIDQDDPCRRQCKPPCDKLRIHPEDTGFEWNCCDGFGLNQEANRFSQYYIHHPHSNQIGNFFDMLNWLVYFFDLPVME